MSTRASEPTRSAPFFDHGLFLLHLNRGKEDLRKGLHDDARRHFTAAGSERKVEADGDDTITRTARAAVSTWQSPTAPVPAVMPEVFDDSSVRRERATQPIGPIDVPETSLRR